MSATLFKNARVIDPAAGLDAQRDLLIGFGRVQAVASTIPREEALRRVKERGGEELTVVDAGGLWLWPGLVDGHAHLREPGFTHKETLETGGRAAVAGGYTTLVCEPNTEPPTDSVQRVRKLAEAAKRRTPPHLYFKAAMTAGRRGRRPVDVAALAGEPACPALSDDGDPVVEPDLMAQLCRLAADHGILLAPHCEDSPRSLQRVAEGTWPGFEPAEAYHNEAGYIRRDAELAAETGCRLHFSHVSLAESVQVIRETRRNGADITFEATPHHLLLCAGDFGAGAAPRVNPPLRSAGDRDALMEALVDGTLDAIATDHAPHTARDKQEGACGLVGLEVALGLVLSDLVRAGKVTPSRAVALTAAHPARIFGLPAGTIRPGAAADLTAIDPEHEWTVEPELFYSKGRNTPFAGRKLRGRATATYVAGVERYSDEEFDRRKDG